MADVKISELTELADSPAAADVVPLVDVSASATKKLRFDNLFKYIFPSTSLPTASRALVSDASSKITQSAVTSTELGYLSGVTSAIQTQLDDRATAPVVNLIYNGNFDLWDRGTSLTQSDDTYALPGWLTVVSSSTLAVSQQTSSPPDGSRYYFRMAPSSQSAGILFFLEAQDAIPLRNKAVSLSFYGKSSSSENIFSTVLAWDGTADSITSDVATAYGAPPTLATNWTYEVSPVEHDANNTWQRFTNENILLDTASLNNIAVFIFGIGIASSNIDIAQVQLQVGPAATDFVPRLVAQERQMAARRYIRMTGDASGNGPAMAGYASAGSEVHRMFIPFPAPMRTTPTATIGGTWTTTNNTFTLSKTSPHGSSMTATAAAGGAFVIETNSASGDYLEFDAEL